MISENVGNIEQVQALINELNFDKLIHFQVHESQSFCEWISYTEN